MRITGNLSGAKTARQKLLYQPDESDKWYKGATPTASEITARIVTVAKTNKQAAAAAFDSLKLLQQQPSSPLYNPYTAPTNASLLALSEIGIDTSKGVTDEWVQQYSYLKDYYRVGASGTPLAPSTKSTPEENAAYHYYKVLQAEDTTRKAETEWAALQEEINYWTNRSDRNYSDEQVLAKIDWAKYPTLAALDEDKQLGTPTALNRPIEYSQDAINGVLYAARNKSTGSAFTDSVKYVMQGGSGYRANKAIAGALDPTSDQYNPYALGSTVDDAALYFGVSSFSSDWVSKNKSILSGTDKAAIKYYNQVQAAEDTTAKAENEWAKLQDEIGYWLARTDRNYSDEEILAKINLDNYPTLKKLDAGREAGEPVALTRAVPYRGNDLAAYVDIMRNGTSAQTPYVQNDMISKKLDPASDEYSPYSVGSTIDDAALYFGTSGFDAQWLVDNKSILSSGDQTAIDYYRDVYDAEQFTQQAESELAELNAEISNWLKYTSDPDVILKEVQDGYPTLQKLDKSMKIGELYPTTRAIDYRWQDIEQYVQQRCAEINAEPTDVLGVPQSDPVSKLKNETINAAGLVIKQIGTPGEKKTFDLAYSSNFGYYVQQIKAKMDSGAISDTAIAGDALAREKEDTANRYGITPAMQSEFEQQMLADLQNRNNSQLVAADAAATDPLKQDSRNVLEKTRDTVYGAASAVYDAAGNALNFVVESAKEMGESTFDLTIGQLMGTTFNQLTEESKGKSGVGVWKTLSAGVLSAGGNFNNAVLGVFANASDLAQYATELVGMKKGRNLARELQAANMNELQKAIAPVLENGTWLENIAMNTISTSINSAAMMAMGVPISNKVTAAFGGGLGTVNTALAEGRIASAAQAAQVSPFVITQMSDTYEQVKEETGNTLQAIASGIFSGLMSLATNNTAYDEYTKRLGLGAESSAAMWARVSGSHMAANWGESALMWTKNALTIMGPAEGLQEVSESLAVKLSRDMWSGGTFDLNEWSQWTEQAKQEFMYGYLSGSLFYVTALPAFAPSRVMLNGMVGGDVATTTETLGEFIAQVAEDVKSEQYKPSVEAAIADVNKAEVIAKKVTSGESLEAARIEATQEIAKMMRDAEYAQRVRNADAAYAEIIEAKEASAPFKAIQNTIAAETEKAQTVDSTQEDQGALEALSKEDRIWNAIPHEGTKAEGFSVNWRIEKRSYGYGDTVEGAEPGYQSAIPTAYQYFVKTDGMQEIKAYSPEDAIRRLEIVDKMARANAARTKQLATPATVGSISAIDAALSTNDLSAHTATIAAALTETDADIDAAVAAGKELADTYGSKEALRVVRDVKQAGVEGAELSMVAAALSKDENATIALDALFTDGSTPENIQKIVTAAHGISDPSGMQAAITDSMVADRVKELIGDGQLQGTQSYESALSQARQNLQTAQDNLEQAQRDYEVSGENAQIENARFIENPTAPETRNGIAQAINELRGKAIVTQQMESSVEKNKTQYVEAKKMLDSARNSAMKVIREQARLDVAQMQAEREAGIKQAMLSSVAAQDNTQASTQQQVQKKELPTMEDNYLKDLSFYADTLYRETSINDALSFDNGENKEYYFANNPDLAIGQGDNKGVLMEFDPADIWGKVNTSKPTWKWSYGNNDAEFVARNNRKSAYMDNIRSITIQKSATGDKHASSKLKQYVKGWDRTINDDGSVTFRRPMGVSTPSNTEPTGNSPPAAENPSALTEQASQPAPAAPSISTSETGKRQFATETAQQPEVMPDWLQEELRTNPAESDYDRQTNKQQMQDGWNRIQQNGYDQTVQELLAKDRFDSIDTATANVILAKAFHDGDTEVALAMASKYNREGTKAGQELQSRKIFSNMSPTGVRVFVAGQIENQTQDYLDTHQAQRDRLNASAQAIIDDIASGSTQETTTYDDRFGMDLTALQRSLIDEYGLNKIARPGLHYNRATTKQRMLEAILAATNTTAENGLTLAKTLEYLNSNVPVVTEADLNYIGARIAEHTDANQTDERIANVAIARAYEAYANIVPETLRNKLRTYRYVSMLLSVPTVLRNIIGNTTQGVSNIAAHRVAVAIDAAIGAITGKRTVTNLNFKERADGWRGFVEETKNTYKDFVTDKVNTRNTDAAKFNVSARGRVYQGQFLETARHIEGFLLSVGDRNFWKKAYINSMTEQQKLVDRGKMIATIEEMQDRAEAEANYATFSEDNAVRDALSKLKEIPGLGELLDFTIPFVGVPTNIIKRMWQFSPLGLTSTVIKHGINAIQGKNFDQNKFVMGMARGLTGTGLFAVGMMLKSIGMIRLGTGDEEDQKVVGVRQAKGDQYTPYIQNPFTGEYVSLSVLAPFVSPITMGAAAQELFDGDEDAGNALLSAAFSGMDQIIDTSYLSTVQDLLYNPGDDSDAAHVGKVLLGSAVSQNVPNIISQIAASLDPYVRDTNDKNWIINTLNRGLISKIPGWRETLPEKVDITGKAVPNTKQGVRALLDPFTSTVAKDDPALNELLRLADATGKTDYFPADALRGKTDTLNGVARPLTPDEKEAYKKRYGTLVFDGGSTIDASGNAVTLQGIRSLMESAAYQNMTDAEKANAISGQVKAAKDGAVSEVVKQVGAEITESPSTEYEKKAPGAMPEYFASLDNAYMTQLNDLYEKTGDGAFIPTAISGTFSRKNKYSGKTEQFTLDSQQMESLWNMYGEELLKLMVKIDWSLPDEELAKALTSAYSTAQGRAKDRWAKQE